jgi:prepilin-type N-terminal cleavage/methylation domain-containing protein
MAMREKGFTLTEMVVAIGVMGILLALAGTLTVEVLKAGRQRQRERARQQIFQVALEEIIGKTLRAQRVTVTEEGLVLESREGRWVIPKTFERQGFVGQWQFAFERPTLLSVTLTLQDASGRTETVQTAVFVPLWRKGGEE